MRETLGLRLHSRVVLILVRPCSCSRKRKQTLQTPLALCHVKCQCTRWHRSQPRSFARVCVRLKDERTNEPTARMDGTTNAARSALARSASRWVAGRMRSHFVLYRLGARILRRSLHVHRCCSSVSRNSRNSRNKPHDHQDVSMHALDYKIAQLASERARVSRNERLIEL